MKQITILKNGQEAFLTGRTLCWFSCGAASAVATKMTILTQPPEQPLEVLYCEVENEHPDNKRFRADCEKWLGIPIIGLRSKKFPSMDIHSVFKSEAFVASNKGAVCTDRLKRQVRLSYQTREDIHVFGYTSDEAKRISKFERNNPELRCVWTLRDLGLTKQHCYDIISQAGIELPSMYKLGYNNNNCIGCVKGGAGYWNKIRLDFPEHFQRMCETTRKIGARIVKEKGKRIYLDELSPTSGNYKFEGDIECGPQCHINNE